MGTRRAMTRRIREEIVDDDGVVGRAPVTRRVVVERRTGGYGAGTNPVGAVIAGILVVFILVLVFGYLL